MQLIDVELEHAPAASEHARRELRMIDAALSPPQAADVRLLCSELIADAVAGAGAGTGDGSGGLRLVVQMDRSRLRLEVFSRSAAGASSAALTARAAPGAAGWGLAVVDRIADSWGMTRRRDGWRSAWCELDRAGNGHGGRGVE
ncbi:MAG: hypothetical protein ACR2HD_00795 [Solirubrobacteraceae bacterium]|nr:MAG: hypothetical protein DLM63_02525 [Solirubrobacterales bacterium]